MLIRRLRRVTWCAVATIALGLLSVDAGAQARFCIDRDTLVFGDRPVGSSTTATVTVSNCGTAPYAFTDVSVHASTARGFAVASACRTGDTLAPGASCMASITFAPTAAGQESGALWLRNTSSTPTQLVTFYGRGTTIAAGSASLAFLPAVLDFGPVPVGTPSAPLGLDLVNRGTVPITPSALVVNGPGAYDFDGTGTCAAGRAIPPGGSCHLDLVFTPKALGARIANLNVDAPELASLAIMRIAGTGVETVAAPVAVDVVEFHHAALDHYFLTAEPAEIAFIDAGGLGSGWSRTGRVLRAWRLDPAPSGAADVCRFFGTPGIGPDSHFYTASSAECALVKGNPDWVYEGVAFRVMPLVGGRCGADAVTVQRLFKPAGEVTGIRHRYVTRADDAHAMVDAGWILEGPVFCAAR